MPNNYDSAISILIIGEEPNNVTRLANLLTQPGVEIETTSDPEKGLVFARQCRPPIVLIEFDKTRAFRLELLDRILDANPSADAVILSEDDSAESAVEAMKHGAKDYLTKPVALPDLRERIGYLIDNAGCRPTQPLFEDSSLDGIVGHSAAIREVFASVRRVAPHYRAVLVTGETGTGKDLIARALHQLSPASSGRYVVLNCSAVVETLFESELFGHARGSFTGATQDKPGLFEVADGGTLFLDEIGDMSIAMQAKLLRVLQNHEVRRVGALHGRTVDVRVVAATNQDLRAAVAERRFREDLFYRLSMVEIKTPSLAERLEDLPLLEHHFVARFAAQFHKDVHGITPPAQLRLARHTWPGNVRELENVLGHATMMTSTDRIDVADLPLYLRSSCGPAAHGRTVLPDGAATLEEHERRLLRWALETTDGNQSKAARMLGIGRDALRYKIKKNHVAAEDSPRQLTAAFG